MAFEKQLVGNIPATKSIIGRATEPESFTDCTVLTLNDPGQTLYGYRFPFALEINRTSYWVEGDLVMWDDD